MCLVTSVNFRYFDNFSMVEADKLVVVDQVEAAGRKIVLMTCGGLNGGGAICGRVIYGGAIGGVHRTWFSCWQYSNMMTLIDR